MAAIASGERIGNYRVEHVLGRDGACAVYEAVHLVLPRRAVVRVADADPTQPAAVQMLREAYILEALQHPGVVRVYESGLLADRRPWSAREHVEGETLEAVLRPDDRAGDLADQIALLRDLASVLEHMHDRGVIHCGLRPSGVLVTGRARGFPLCLVDFRSARPHDAEPAPYPVTPEAWAYTAPELAAGEPFDDRTDVFALGVIAYQVLTGAAPYEDRAVATGPGGARFHIPAALRRPDAPRELTALVDQMVAYAREDRPRSAEAHEALASCADLLARAAQVMPRIRRPRWTPPLAFEERARELEVDPSAPIELMRFGDGIE